MIRIETVNSSPLCRQIDFENHELQVNVCNLVEHPIHFHRYLEIVFVIKGSVSLKSCCNKFTLHEGEFATINPYELHSIKKYSDEAVIAYIYFGSEIYDTEESTLLLEPELLKKDRQEYEKIRENIIKIVKLVFSEGGNVDDTADYARTISAVLKTNFKRVMYTFDGEKNEYDGDSVYFERLDNIGEYLYSRYDEKLSLGDVAEYFNVSKYYLAHFIKRRLGLTFKELLNFIRIDRSEIEILEGKVSIGQIGDSMGFSSPQYFTSCFKKFFGMTPFQYRKMYYKETIQFKEFDEEKCIPGSLRLGIEEERVNMNLPDFAAIVDLKDENYNMTVLKDSGNGFNTEEYSGSTDDRRICMNLDCEEMIIIIKRK